MFISKQDVGVCTETNSLLLLFQLAAARYNNNYYYHMCAPKPYRYLPKYYARRTIKKKKMTSNRTRPAAEQRAI